LLIEPWLAAQAPTLLNAPLPNGVIVAFVVALVTLVAGAALLALPFLRGRASPRWVGYALPASALLTLAGEAVASGGPTSNPAINLLTNAGPALLLVALVGIAAGGGTMRSMLQDRDSQPA
jgi:hypothetical protein